MRYELKRNSKGMITQCETNADGGNIYARREEINKQALANLERPTPGKLGDLSNLQVFNFGITNFESGTTVKSVFTEYNTTETTGNVTDCVMFNVDSINNKALYYNIVDIKADLSFTNGANSELLRDSFVQLYLLENIETSTTSLGRKIPSPAPINGTSSGTVNFETTGAKNEYQSISTSLGVDSVIIPNTLNGIRASGLALKTIKINTLDNEDFSTARLNIYVYVNVKSVSSSK